MPWMHPNPRKRYGMETARFMIYLTVPVIVITICSDPKNMNMLLRGFNFVEYPPESKKLPSAKEIVKSMEEREAKRRAAAARAGVDAHLAAAGALKRAPTSQKSDTTLDATAKVPPTLESLSEGDHQPPAGARKGWFGRWR